MSNITSTIQYITVAALPFVFALTLVPAAQAYLMNHLGDDTPKKTGRLTWNPAAHIDLIGTILLPIAFIFLQGLSTSGGLGLFFGWAKPIELNWRNIKNPKLGLRMLGLVELATQLGLALIWSLIFIMLIKFGGFHIGSQDFLPRMALTGIQISAMFLVFALLPFPPYGLGRVLLTYLPPSMAQSLAKIESYSFMIVIALILSGILIYPLRTMFGVFLSIIDLFL